MQQKQNMCVITNEQEKRRNRRQNCLYLQELGLNKIKLVDLVSVLSVLEGN